jgi:predicted O-methyltransferase YrrM
MSFFHSLSKAALTPILKRNAKKKLRKLVAEQNPLLASIYGAIDDALDEKLSEEEDTWVRRLQTLRDRLGSDDAEVEILDFGAGKRVTLDDAEQVQVGRVRKERIGDLCRSTNKPRFWTLVLFRLVRAIQPNSCLEMGTCLGLSAMHQAAALKLNGNGRLTTMEGAPDVARLAKANMDELGFDNIDVVVGSFAETLPETAKNCAPIDYAFIDGHHEEQATIDFYHALLESLANPAVLVFDDISWSPGMQRAWKTIAEHDSVKAAINLRAVGIVVIDREMQKQETISLPLV